MVDEICHEFFAGEGARMRWPDRKMLRQLAWGTWARGSKQVRARDGRHEAPQKTVVSHLAGSGVDQKGHGTGARVDDGRHDGPVDRHGRRVPKQVAHAFKWKLGPDGILTEAVKPRVATDKSVMVEDSTSDCSAESRNTRLNRDE